MSSRCIISIRNENWLKREIKLYQNTDGHPNSMMMPLISELRDIYQEFKEHGDVDWFLDPGKLAGVLITRSVPVLTDEIRNLMKSLPTVTKNKLESNLFLGIPNLLPESKPTECNYEYLITLKENTEESDRFLGYNLEIYKLQHNRRISTIMTSEENFLSRALVPRIENTPHEQ